LKTVPSIRRLPFVRDFFLGKDETVIVNGDIKVTVIDIDGDGDDVTLAIEIPEWMEIGEIESFQEMELASTG
jgi:sRNA-binding carbon storage regulator CsrA